MYIYYIYKMIPWMVFGDPPINLQSQPPSCNVPSWYNKLLRSCYQISSSSRHRQVLSPSTSSQSAVTVPPVTLSSQNPNGLPPCTNHRYIPMILYHTYSCVQQHPCQAQLYSQTNYIVTHKLFSHTFDHVVNGNTLIF